MLRPYKSVLTPDFSMYTEMPLALQLFNTFLNRWCGAYFAEKGLRVVPTVSWGLDDSFDFCFAGIENGSAVAVSTYMFHEHGNHSNQKDIFMNGYNEMLKRIEPKYVICYSEPFKEMTGNIIYVDYELSLWRHMNDGIVLEKDIKRTYGVRPYVCRDNFVYKGGGSAYGGEWKPSPSKPNDARFIGEPNTVSSSTYNNKKGTDSYVIENKYDENGKAIMERHYTDHNRPDVHTNPHDHMVDWSNGYPKLGPYINYEDGNIPTFKNFKYTKGDRIMQIIEYEPEDFRFESLSELKFCILCGSEITFIYQNHIYGIGKIEENKFYIGSCITPEQPKCDDDLISDNVEDILNYSLGDRKLRECLNDIEVIERTL